MHFFLQSNHGIVGAGGHRMDGSGYCWLLLFLVHIWFESFALLLPDAALSVIMPGAGGGEGKDCIITCKCEREYLIWK